MNTFVSAGLDWAAVELKKKRKQAVLYYVSIKVAPFFFSLPIFNTSSKKVVSIIAFCLSQMALEKNGKKAIQHVGPHE